jgi:hypothetical protein
MCQWPEKKQYTRSLNDLVLFTVLFSGLMAEEVSAPAYYYSVLPPHPIAVSSDGVLDALQPSSTAFLHCRREPDSNQGTGSCHTRARDIGTAEASELQERAFMTAIGGQSRGQSIWPPEHVVKSSRHIH